MKKLAGFLIVLLIAAAPATAQTRPGALDKSFGAKGRVLAQLAPPGSEYEGLWTATSPEGNFLALSGNARAGFRLMRFLADGSTDQAFGNGGSVQIAAEPGWSFSPAGLAVDSQGRVVVAGTTSPPANTGNHAPGEPVPGPAPSRAVVIRYLANGNPDPSFGKAGITTTSFELPPPRSVGDAPGQPRYESAVVSATALVVTDADQPIVAGTYATIGNGSCYARAGYVGRLAPDGSIDKSFGTEGVAYDSQIQQPEVLAQAKSGDLFSSGLTQPNPLGGCQAPGPASPNGNFAALLSTGQPSLGFGEGGERPHDQSLVRGMAVDSRGRLISLEVMAYPSKGDGKVRVRRLLPSGAPDPAFGRNGSVWPKVSSPLISGRGLTTVAVDSRNRILLAGGGKAPSGALGFQLMRLGTRGKLDRGFGRRGRVKTGFGTAAETMATALALDGQGNVLLGGAITGSPKLEGGNGLAFARYLTG